VLYVQLRGGEGEGALDPASGWLVASSIGKFPLALSATVPGSRPFVDTTSTEFDVVPGPAVRMELAPSSATIVEGQLLRLSALAYSKANDRTLDAVRWQSSRPRIVAVDGDGTITGLAPGRSTLTASVRGASASLDVRVVPGSGIAKLAVRPSKPSVRQGDVVAFSAEGRDGAGRHRSGVLEQSWRLGGASGAEIGALEAFRADPSLKIVRAMTREVYGETPALPPDAVIYFSGVDPSVGALTKYALTELYADAR
jgi:hypothetical protein